MLRLVDTTEPHSGSEMAVGNGDLFWISIGSYGP